MRKGKKILLGLVMAAALGLMLSGCAKDNAADGGEGLQYSKTDKDITVTLTTDKENYKKGEEISYTLTLSNNRKGYTISRGYVQADHADDVFETEVTKDFNTVKFGEEASYEGTIVVHPETEYDTNGKKSKSSLLAGVESVTIRPYVKVNYDGEEILVRYVVEILMYQEKVDVDTSYKKSVQTVSCHDPSIIVGTDKDGQKCYYIFGSHLAWAKSYDLENWKTFTNNINTNYSKIFAEPKKWSAHGSANYSVNGYMWAPDVIYNEAMGKYCMYMSIDGDFWYSSIVLLTADELWGDWTYEGIVVYSGFRTDEFYDETDVAKVTGETEMAARYSERKWGDNYPNNIDPCVFYDDDGNLWMSYGSWSGGIFMLEMDEETGFRDYSVKYEDTPHSDPYFGNKIAGGKYVSGEASYIQKIGDYYWLFMSYGALEAKGGYNIRVFRSETPDGVYLDEKGNTPYFDEYVLNFNLSVGERLFGGYKWPTFSNGQVAQGHNSAFVDDDGRAYVVFHTRTTNGTEGHYVKVHQLFLNKNGWLVAAPYQTSGETFDNKVPASEVAGSYGFIMHKLNIDYSNLEAVQAESITLNADGTIDGEYDGTWVYDEKTGYIDLVINRETYSGVLLKMNVENTTKETVVFTALGETNQITVWGSKEFE